MRWQRGVSAKNARAALTHQDQLSEMRMSASSKFLFGAVALAAAVAAHASPPVVAHGQPAQGYELARVLSSVPIVQQVSVPRQVCTTVPVHTQVPVHRSGYSRNAPGYVASSDNNARSDAGSVAGMVIGGLVGGALGNQVGKGSGRAVATASGILGGAALGYNAGGRTRNDTTTTSSSGQTHDGVVVHGPVTTVYGPDGRATHHAPVGTPDYVTQVRHEQRCTTEQLIESRTVAYNVTYEYAGRQYTTRFANDPGQWVQIQVAPVGAVTSHAPTTTHITHTREWIHPVHTVHPAPNYRSRHARHFGWH
jgi:uncharacterized protein YcfJ